MAILKTPWGPIEVKDLVPTDFECGQCGRCCSGFVLGMRDYDKEIWYKRFLANSPYEYPPDIGAIKHLFVKIPNRFSADGQQLHTCLAFDREKKRCTIFKDAPGIRPVACWSFPYNYGLEDLWDFPYPGCKMFLQTLKMLLDKGATAMADCYNPLRQSH